MQELAALQGLGSEDWVEFGLSELSEPAVKDFLGNSLLGKKRGSVPELSQGSASPCFWRAWLGLL